jgi:transposase
MQNLISIPLNLPEVRVEKTEIRDDGSIHVRVECTEEGTRCPKCGKHIVKPYGHAPEREVRHISALGAPVYISFLPERFECPVCGCTAVQRPSWISPGSSCTVPFEQHVLLQLVNSTVEDVSVKENIGYDAVEGILDRYISKKVNWNDINSLPVIGVDEFSVKKGHGSFYTIVSARIGNKTVVLAILKGREKKTVKEFFSSIPKRLRKTVRVVCSDMYDGYINAAKEVFPKRVRVTADRFHVAKLYRGCVDTLRKSELRRLKKELPKEEYTKLKNAMWILRKSPEILTEEERETLKVLFKHSPDLELAYMLSNELTDIFNENISRKKARRKIISWKRKVSKSGLDCFDSFLNTLTAREKEILNYFDGRHTSGFVEGLNNKIKVIKRRCYGLVNLERWFQRLHLDLAGYELFA